MAQTTESVPTPPAVPYLERRTYVAAPGKFEAILGRFRDHTLRYFAKHDISVVTFGYDADPPGELEYTIAWRDGGHQEIAWAAFLGDDEWVAIRTETQRDGLLVDEVRVRLLLVPEWF